MKDFQSINNYYSFNQNSSNVKSLLLSNGNILITTSNV